MVVPTITLYEVFKFSRRYQSLADVMRVIQQMKTRNVVPLDDELALSAASVAAEYKLAMADSIILATTRAYNATLWTQDADFKGIEGIEYIAKA